MSKSRKSTASEELRNIEDALVESLLNASGQEVRDEMILAEIDPDGCIAEVDAAISSARATSARQRLEDARVALDAWRAKDSSVGDVEREGARALLARFRSGDRTLDEKLMLAARKGQGLSERDLEGLIEDLAALERMEREDEDE